MTSDLVNNTIQSKINQSIFEKQEFENDMLNVDFEFSNIDDNQVDIITNTDIFFPTVPDFDLWESFLSRSLEKEERKIFHNYLLENDTNLQIKSLHYNLILNGPYSIPKLTKNNGNCLFESLSHLGYGTPSEIRKNIAALLLLVKNNNYFFPGLNTCPEELFINCNDVDVVKDGHTGKVYEYDYNVMILDLYTNHSWSRLPMELILMTVSRIYEVHIKIFSNKSEYINVVSVWNSNNEDKSEINTVYLGHLNEEHYVPVIKLDNEISSNSLIMDEFYNFYPKYISAKNEYHKWRKEIVLKLEISNRLYRDINSPSIRQNSNSLTINHIQLIPTNQELYFDLEQIKDFDDFEIVK
jgi:hypothetical protein